MELAEIYNKILLHGLGGPILIFFFFNSNQSMGKTPAKGGKGAAAGGAAASAGKRARGSAAKIAVDEAAADAAAADAAAEGETMRGETESDSEGAGGAKRQTLSPALLERRLGMANTQKAELATRVAELEKKLAEKDAPAVSPRPATGAKAAAKVEHRLIL